MRNEDLADPPVTVVITRKVKPGCRRLRSKRTKNNALAVQFSGQNRGKALLHLIYRDY